MSHISRHDLCEVCGVRDVSTCGSRNNSISFPNMIEVLGAPSIRSSKQNGSEGATTSSRQISRKTCSACKKFYRRIKLTEPELLSTKECTCVNLVPDKREASGGSSSSRHQPIALAICRACRAKKCHMLQLPSKISMNADVLHAGGQPFNNEQPNNTQTESAPATFSTIIVKQEAAEASSSCDLTTQRRRQVSVKLIPCQICGTSSSGYHFGAMTCEGCKGFFRRAVGQIYPCLFDGVSKFEKGTDYGYFDRIDRCKHCRLDACLRVGMSLDSVRRGRRSLIRKLETSHYVESLYENNQLLESPVDRQRKRSCDEQQPFFIGMASSSLPSLSVSWGNQVGVVTPSTSGSTTPAQESVQSCPEMSTSVSTELAFVDQNFSNVPFAAQPYTSYYSPPVSSAIFSIQSVQMPDFVQTISEAGKFLQEIWTNPGVTLTQEMTPLDQWKTILTGSFDFNVNAITNFDKRLPGFQELAQPDKTKLFANSYFSKLMATLSLQAVSMYSTTNNGVVVIQEDINPFSLKNDGRSMPLFQHNFPEIEGLVQGTFFEACSYMASWRPSQLELALFCGLLFFNPNVPNLSSPDIVNHFFNVYKQSYLKVADLLRHQSSQEAEESRLNQMLTFFNASVSPVLTVVMQRLASSLPYVVDAHPIWAEMNRVLGVIP